MREKNEKKEIISKYEDLYGPIQGDIYEQPWYTEYLSKFQFINYLTPEELADDFDWDLLQKLVLSSFSSDYELKRKNGDTDYELYIAVKGGEQSVIKTISELWSFQVLRLYEIYIEEQLNMQILRGQTNENGESNMEYIDNERETRLRKWRAVVDTMDREKLAQDTKASQEEMLDDLMGKL